MLNSKKCPYLGEGYAPIAEKNASIKFVFYSMITNEINLV